MSGICSAHQHHEPGCPRCEAPVTTRHDKATVYYFGCWERPGHYYWLPGSDGYPYRPGRDFDQRTGTPWGLAIDSRRFSYGPAYGSAVIEYKDGWTVIGFPDNTVDSRPGSMSAFLFDHTLDFDRALAAAKEAFAAVFDRFPFEVVERAAFDRKEQTP